MSEPSQAFVVSVPTTFDLSQRQRVGMDIIRHIRSRTSKGLDIHNRPFPAYSKEYVASKDFRNAGKIGKPNLTLTGEMLNLLSILGTGTGWIKIGFDDRDENDKASWNRIKGRNFMGISAPDLRMIIERHEQQTPAQQAALDISQAVGEELARSLFGGAGGEGNDT